MSVWHRLHTSTDSVLCIKNLLSFIDRVNIGNARVARLQTDLKMSNCQFPRSGGNLYSVYRRQNPRESCSQVRRRIHPASHHGHTLGTHHHSTRLREWLTRACLLRSFSSGYSRVGCPYQASCSHEPVLQAGSNPNAHDTSIHCRFVGWRILWSARIQHSRDGGMCRTQRLAVNLHSGV